MNRDKFLARIFEVPTVGSHPFKAGGLHIGVFEVSPRRPGGRLLILRRWWVFPPSLFLCGWCFARSENVEMTVPLLDALFYISECFSLRVFWKRRMRRRVGGLPLLFMGMGECYHHLWCELIGGPLLEGM